MTRREKYQNAKPIAAMGLTNTAGLGILEIQYGIDDYVILRGTLGDIHRCKIYSNTKGMYIKYGRCRYYLDEFMRV